jgi:hypothetical protein
MHLELPLEQLFRRRGKGTQLPFATEAMERVPRRNEFVATPSPLGLHVLAKDEEALEVPAVTLREAYGKDLDILAPRVRLIEGVRVEEPIMHVEITVDRRHEAKVRRAMARRSAQPSAELERLLSIIALRSAARRLARPPGGARPSYGRNRHALDDAEPLHARRPRPPRAPKPRTGGRPVQARPLRRSGSRLPFTLRGGQNHGNHS